MLRYLTSGESHGPQLTAIVTGLPAGLPVRAQDVNRELKRRQGGYGRGGRMTIEADTVRIVSGVRHGRTLGSPITLVVENRDWKNWTRIMSPDPLEEADAASEGETSCDPEHVASGGSDPQSAIRNPQSAISKRAVTRPRPGHADLSGCQKFGHTDARNILERASARGTATQVAVGALCKALLAEFGIRVLSHVTELCGIQAPLPEELGYDELARRAEASELRVADPSIEEAMRRLIDDCKAQGDTVGGVFEVIVTGLPSGLGNVMNWDEKLDGKIGQVMMSMQAIKGVEIGMGFEAARRRGSQVHDPIYYTADPARLPEGHGPSGGFYRATNRAGGLEGGMTNGEPLVVRAAMKPIATLMQPIASVDLVTREPFAAGKERSDVCALPAAAVIGEALVAYAVAWAFLQKFGGDSLAEVRRNYEGYAASLG